MNPHHLYDPGIRCLLRVTGEDALPFLQNLVTNDVRAVSEGRMQYACLLTAQGQVLHEFFILPGEEGGYFLDCVAEEKADFVRRLSMYKLRSRVNFDDTENYHVYAALSFEREMAHVFPDPRLAALGYRIYTKEKLPADSSALYDDFCISLGVPTARAIKAGKDYIAALNLDLLGAVSWEKGCFVGQELTARMHHRGLARKRLLIVEGAHLKAGNVIFQSDIEVGEIRAVNAQQQQGLALLKLEVLQRPDAPLLDSDKNLIKIHVPAYLLQKS
jgi:hypothetical protein